MARVLVKSGSILRMERMIRVFATHQEAAAANRAEYRAMAPQRRLDLALELGRRHREGLGESASRFERVCRIVDRPWG